LTAGSPHASASGTSFEVCENSGITVRIETESLCELHRKTQWWFRGIPEVSGAPFIQDYFVARKSTELVT
jgi:hypothetical protein